MITSLLEVKDVDFAQVIYPTQYVLFVISSPCLLKGRADSPAFFAQCLIPSNRPWHRMLTPAFFLVPSNRPWHRILL